MTIRISTATTKRLFVSVASRVARNRVLDAIGKRKSWYRISKPLRHSRGIYEVTPEEYERVKDMRGVATLRDTEGLAECW